MTGKTSSYTGGRYGVSHQCELSNVNATEMNQKMTLYSEGSYGVFRQCELINVSSIV
jgi:hypothetical protein